MGDELLEALRSKAPGTCNRDLMAELERLDGTKRAVVRNADGGYEDIGAENVTTETIAIDARADGEEDGTHGTEDEARPPYDPTETAIVLMIG